jgi:hypothetical protein
MSFSHGKKLGKNDSKPNRKYFILKESGNLWTHWINLIAKQDVNI